MDNSQSAMEKRQELERNTSRKPYMTPLVLKAVPPSRMRRTPPILSPQSTRINIGLENLFIEEEIKELQMELERLENSIHHYSRRIPAAETALVEDAHKYETGVSQSLEPKFEEQKQTAAEQEAEKKESPYSKKMNKALPPSRFPEHRLGPNSRMRRERSDSFEREVLNTSTQPKSKAQDAKVVPELLPKKNNCTPCTPIRQANEMHYNLRPVTKIRVSERRLPTRPHVEHSPVVTGSNRKGGKSSGPWSSYPQILKFNTNEVKARTSFTTPPQESHSDYYFVEEGLTKKFDEDTMLYLAQLENRLPPRTSKKKSTKSKKRSTSIPQGRKEGCKTDSSKNSSGMPVKYATVHSKIPALKLDKKLLNAATFPDQHSKEITDQIDKGATSLNCGIELFHERSQQKCLSPINHISCSNPMDKEKFDCF